MPITVLGGSSKNRLECADGFFERSNGVINFMGEGSSVRIASGTWGYDLSLSVEHGCTLEIGEDCALGALEVFSVRGSSVSIGARCGFTSKAQIHAHEKNAIRLGTGCLVASSVWLTCSDMHPIFDLTTGERINPGADITIGDAVWIANNVTILKGVTIGRGSIVGTGSVVTKSVEANCLAAGNPAKIIKTDVTWRYSLEQASL